MKMEQRARDGKPAKCLNGEQFIYQGKRLIKSIY